MAFPPILLLLLAGGAAAVMATTGKKKGKLYEHKPLFSPGAQATAPPLATPSPLTPFGEGAPGEFPAPYRLQDAIKIANIVLAAGAETAPAFRPHYDTIVQRVRDLKKVNIPPAYKTFALIRGVVIPAIAANLFWHWYRPRTDVRKKKYAAICAWAFMFNALPETACADKVIRDPNVLHGGGGHYTLDSWGEYLQAGNIVCDLTPLEIRGVLHDLAIYMKNWPENYGPGGGDWVEEFETRSEQHLDDIYAQFPLYDTTAPPITGPYGGEGYPASPDDVIIEGNFAYVDFMMWWAAARVEMQIKVDFDEAAAWAALIVNVIGVIAGAAGAFVSPAVAAIITAATSTIQGLAIAYADGEITTQEMQGVGGAAVALALKIAGIDLGLGDYLAQLEHLMEQPA